MLTFARHKANKWDLDSHDITYIHGDAQEIPLNDESVGHVTISYGIRNVKDAQRCIHEAYRVLKPSGRLGILELTRPENPLLRVGHRFFLRWCLPILGKWVTTNRKAYEYLCSSIESFVPPAQLRQYLTNAGFDGIQSVPLSGGIATITYGTKT